MLVGGLVGYGVYKMSTRDAERVEQKSGVSAEEMTDEELAQTMDELGIDKQRIESSDQEVDDASAAASPGTGSAAEELTKLAALHDQGVLTDAEFEAQKQKLLGS